MAIGRLVCGYYGSEIDWIIDRHVAHDKARMSCDTLFSQARVVLGKHGRRASATTCYTTT
jgi:hypothetical protein